MTNTGDAFVDFLKKASELRKGLPEICGRLKHLNLIKRQDKKQDEKISNFLRHYFEDSEIDDWDFLSEPIPDGPYSSVSSFFAAHDSSDLQYLFGETGRVVVPKALFFGAEYNMKWIQTLPRSQREGIFEAYFNLENERKERNRLIQALNKVGASYCYELHTRYSRRNYTDAAKRAGFQRIFVKSEPRERPKIFLYIGERK